MKGAFPSSHPTPTPHTHTLLLQVLSKAGFLYDSSINEVFPSRTSPNKNSRLWPYTMDAGIPQVLTLGGSVHYF